MFSSVAAVLLCSRTGGFLPSACLIVCRLEGLLQTRHDNGIRSGTFCLHFHHNMIKCNHVVNVASDFRFGDGKQRAGLLPALCPTAVSAESGANITNEPLVQTLLINGAERPGRKELTKQTRHGVSLHSFIPSVFSLGRERLVVWVRSMLG